MDEIREKNKTLTLKNDYLFKAVYGSDDKDSKYILKALLNKILNRENDPITHIEYRNPFQPKQYLDDKETILDIKAFTSRNELIDIEMQIVWDKYMPYRLIFYHGGLLREALSAGEHYSSIKPTITICITNSVAFKETNQYMNEFYFIENNEHFQLTDHTKICCIELPKVNLDRKPLNELSPLEICLEYLRCAGDNSDEYVQELIQRGGKELEMAQEKLRKFTEDEIMRERAFAREMWLHDQATLKHGYEELARGQNELKVARNEFECDRTEFERNRAELENSRAEFEKNLAEFEKNLAEFENIRAKFEYDRAEFEKENARIDQEKASMKEKLSGVIKNLCSNNFTDEEFQQMAEKAFDEIIKLN